MRGKSHRNLWHWVSCCNRCLTNSQWATCQCPPPSCPHAQLICWKKGQASRVHNHAQVPSLSCWQHLPLCQHATLGALGWHLHRWAAPPGCAGHASQSPPSLPPLCPQSHCWLNVLSGGVEELRFTTGDTPVVMEPALAPRLPGVISATAPCPLLTPAGAHAGGSKGEWRGEGWLRGRTPSPWLLAFVLTGVLHHHRLKQHVLYPLLPLQAWARWVQAALHTSMTPLRCMLCGVTTWRVALRARRARSACTCMRHPSAV